MRRSHIVPGYNRVDAGENESATIGDNDMLGNEELEAGRAVAPGKNVRHFPIGLVLRSVLSLAGLLLAGAGLCSGAFCGIAFDDAQEAQLQTDRHASFVAELAKSDWSKQPAATEIPWEGQKLTLAEWQDRVARWERDSLRKWLRAYELLSLSIGLFLGGTTVWLLGWGLRPRSA